MNPDANDVKAFETLSIRIEKSIESRNRRQQSKPGIHYPDLPVCDKVNDIISAITAHQVVIICGETGSGKTTQLPKICLQAGRGIQGLIGHTQPRRIAARTVASRIAEELGSSIGDTVGYKIRFHDRTRSNNLIKVMTDGILLAETQADRFLNEYDTLIIDEAHERSLNIDFLLGYLKWLLPRRPDLKVLITSATLDTKAFSQHFDQTPVIAVGGRSYPIDIRYRPIADRAEKDSISAEHRALLDSVAEIREQESGDILVFFSGERDIREAAEILSKHGQRQNEILPLYSRLNIKDQQRVFEKHKQPRIILSTNVAETSLTVPGVRAVIDFGKARISRYSYRSKLQRLPVEPVSQSSARQRAGRCGRLGPGICIRLYSEEDFNQRPEFTEPEILRTNLAAVILQMTVMRLGDIQSFPFVEAPGHKMIRDGIKTLIELKAFNDNERITKLGRQLARLPVDPRLGRMLLAANEAGCLTELSIITAGLSIQDPRERPVDQTKAADKAHQSFIHEDSDFLGLLNIWNSYLDKKARLSNRKLRQYCRDNFLSYRRMQEWHDIHCQLLEIVKGQMKFVFNAELAHYDAIHRAILPGLLLHVGMREDSVEYQGLRNKRFFLHPGSVLFESKPKWVVSAEQTETTRLFARTVAKVKPSWIESCARHLSKRELFDAHWSRKRKRVFVYERILLSGLVLVPRRRIPYDTCDRTASREIFIRSALVQMEFSCQAEFFKHNRALIEAVEYLQHKRRRPDLMVSDEQLFEWFDARLPQTIWDGHTLDQWLAKSSHEQTEALKLSINDVLKTEQSEHINRLYPDQFKCGEHSVQLQYLLEPGHQLDGVSAVIPLHQLSQLNPLQFQWLVPGLLYDKLCGLIRTLPKALRKQFVPVTDCARECQEQLEFGCGSLHEQLIASLKSRSNVHLTSAMLDENGLDDYLRMNFVIVDGDQTLGVSKDLEALQRQFMGDAVKAFSNVAETVFNSDISREWTFGEIPDKLSSRLQSDQVSGFPALTAHRQGVRIELYETEKLAHYQHRNGLICLLGFSLKKELDYVRRKILTNVQAQLQYNLLPANTSGTGSQHTDYFEEIYTLILAATFLEDGIEIRTQQQFEAVFNEHKSKLIQNANDIQQLLVEILQSRQSVIQKINQKQMTKDVSNDMIQQINCLFYQGFLSQTPFPQIKQYPRYLKAMHYRMDKASENIWRDQQALAELHTLWEPFWNSVTNSTIHQLTPPAMDTFRWSLEELRVSLFAQQLKTAYPVSIKRLEKQWHERI